MKKNSSLVRNLKIDMTPLVDISFILLLAFFVVDFYRQKSVLELGLPKDSTYKPFEWSCENNTMNIIIAKSCCWIHPKRFLGNLESKHLRKIETNLDLRSEILFQRKNVLDTSKFMVVIKPTPRCNYGDFVKVLNEIKITRTNYIIDDISKNETELLAKLSLH